MGLRFIFMLTRNDRTVVDASQHLQTALSLGVRHIGFKDIGLPIEQLKALNGSIQAHGVTSYLEVVSLDRESEIVSAKAAVDIGVDVLLGGTRVDDVLPILQGTGIQYFPFPGRISGHPSVLEGSIEEIVQSAKAITAHEGVHGLDLLAYRSKEDVPDRDEVIEEGEFIVVPHGVEHRPVALESACEVLLFDPAVSSTWAKGIQQ